MKLEIDGKTQHALTATKTPCLQLVVEQAWTFTLVLSEFSSRRKLDRHWSVTGASVERQWSVTALSQHARSLVASDNQRRSVKIGLTD